MSVCTLQLLDGEDSWSSTASVQPSKAPHGKYESCYCIRRGLTYGREEREHLASSAVALHGEDEHLKLGEAVGRSRPGKLQSRWPVGVGRTARDDAQFTAGMTVRRVQRASMIGLESAVPVYGDDGRGRLACGMPRLSRCGGRVTTSPAASCCPEVYTVSNTLPNEIRRRLWDGGEADHVARGLRRLRMGRPRISRSGSLRQPGYSKFLQRVARVLPGSNGLTNERERPSDRGGGGWRAAPEKPRLAAWRCLALPWA